MTGRREAATVAARWVRESSARLIAAAALAGVAAGVALWTVGQPPAAHWFWAAVTAACSSRSQSRSSARCFDATWASTRSHWSRWRAR